ncbi:addiction module antidote protein [Candidatus Regiella endosymbiont of Tuberolachnus salignus]|uniref:addiction module antidote protein n=1 Tax=Candidatus Regiella endosymbiont of Tuberolachnus salignus TaxID=3077956 RepID=UPI0030D38B4A
MNKSRSHDETVIEMIRNDPDFAEFYLHAAFEELDEESGEAGFLLALRHIVEARGGMGMIAEKAGLSRESLYRALSPKGNPTLKTMKQVVHATGLKFAAIA